MRIGEKHSLWRITPHSVSLFNRFDYKKPHGITVPHNLRMTKGNFRGYANTYANNANGAMGVKPLDGRGNTAKTHAG